MKNTEKSYLYIWSGFALFYSTSMANSSHTHYAASILHSFGEPLELEVANGDKLRMQTVFLPSNYKHRLHSNSAILILQIDPDSPEYLPLRKFSKDKPSNLTGKIKLDVKEISLLSNCTNAIELVRKVIYQIAEPELDKKTSRAMLDYRIKDVIRYLKTLEELPPKISLASLAKMASLSPDRFRHLFAQEMGLSIRRYLLWLRVRKIGYLLQKGFSLTDAAHDAGFTDSSHFSKTFKQNFGISPSNVLTNPNVHVKYCEK